MTYQRAAIEEYLKGVPATAPIRAVVASPAVQDQLKAFEKADQDAIIAQARYRRYAYLALAATTLSALAGAVLILPLGQVLPEFPRPAASLIQTVSLLVSVIAIQWLLWRRPLDDWLASRARAEQLRGRIFEAILAEGTEDGGSSALVRQKLDCAMAAHVEDQLAFFKNSATRHRTTARALSPLSVLGYLLLTLAVAIGFLGLPPLLTSFHVSVMPEIVAIAAALTPLEHSQWQLGFGTMASNLLAHMTARSMLDQDERKASLYEATADRISELVGAERAATEAAADQGDLAAVTAFFERLRRVLEGEHAAWSLSRPPKNPVRHRI